jgi:plastocyanin
MKKLSLFTLMLVLGLSMGCEEQLVQESPTTRQSQALGADEGAAAKGGPATTATVRFGNPDVGSPFRPPDPHDQSFHSIDNVIPTTTVISAGGTVTFELAEFHQAAVYAPGTRPDDIDATDVTNLTDPGSGAVIIPGFLIDFADDPAFLDNSPFAFAPQSWEMTFDEPGRYLVICAVVPHFVESKMYAYVHVK